MEPGEADRSDKPGYIRRGRYDAEQFSGIRENSLRTLMSVDDAAAAFDARRGGLYLQGRSRDA